MQTLYQWQPSLLNLVDYLYFKSSFIPLPIDYIYGDAVIIATIS